MGCYNTTINWASERGLTLDKRIERREENGVYGMYATADIPAGEVIISYPIDKLVQPSKVAPESLPKPIQLMVTSAVEKNKGENSDYFGCFSMLESYEELQQKSVFFFDQSDLQMLEKLSPILSYQVRNTQREMHEFAKMVKSSQPDLDDALIVEIVLNFVSRGWGNLGFIPVMDLFNHCDNRGAKLKQIQVNGQRRIGWVSRVAYKKGDQIYGSYARKDMVSLATKYNYFDPEGTHFIDFAPRVLQPVQSQFKEKLCQLLSQKYQAQLVEVNGQKHFKLNEAGLFFTERAPSTKLIDYFRDNSFDSEQELAQGRYSDQKMLRNMLNTIEAFLQANRVDDFKLEDISPKLHRFFHLLKKEKDMLLENRQWILDNLEF